MLAGRVTRSGGMEPIALVGVVSECMWDLSLSTSLLWCVTMCDTGSCQYDELSAGIGELYDNAKVGVWAARLVALLVCVTPPPRSFPCCVWHGNGTVAPTTMVPISWRHVLPLLLPVSCVYLGGAWQGHCAAHSVLRLPPHVQGVTTRVHCHALPTKVGTLSYL